VHVETPASAAGVRTRLAAALALGGAALWLLLPVVGWHSVSRLGGRSDVVRPAAPNALPAGLGEAASAALGADKAAFQVRRRGGALVAAGAGLTTRFARSGVTIGTRGAQVRIRFLGLGDGTNALHTRASAPVAARNRVTYRRGGVSEWYANGPLGLEQGFTLLERPSGNSRGTWLTLAQSWSGPLHARQSGDAIDFARTATGAPLLTYSGLRATDATGRSLPAQMELAKNRVLLRVDDSGARYPLTIDPLVQQGSKLTPSDGAGSGKFGWSVAFSANGNTALVGAPAENGNAGSAWVFVRSGGIWTQQARLPADGESGAGQFGWSVALSASGDTALVGAPTDASGAGAAWFFTRSGTTWTAQGPPGDPKVVPPDEGGAAPTAQFGWSVSLAGNASLALIGGPSDNGNFGAAWVYTPPSISASWNEQQKIVPPPVDETAGTSQFGWSVTLAANSTNAPGNALAVIGGPADGANAGAAWVYNNQDGWLRETKLVPTDETGGAAQFGWSVSLAGDSTDGPGTGIALIGGPADNSNAGAAWVYSNPNGWLEIQKLTPSDASGSAEFGYSVALAAATTNGPGTGTALVGGFADSGGTGASWVFTNLANGWQQQGTKLTAADESGAGAFGLSVALASDGSTALIGGPTDAAGSAEGAAWPFATGIPGVTGEASQNVTDTSATVTASINPNGSSTSFVVNYGTTTAYGQQTAPVAIGSGSSPQAVTQSLTGLSPQTTYHFQFVATSSAGTNTGPDVTFTTSAPPGGGGGGGAPPTTTTTPTTTTAPATTTTPAAVPPPVLGVTVNIIPKVGTVLVNGVPLQNIRQIPIGAIIDARNGTVTLQSILADGTIQSMDFAGGIFKITQDSTGLTILTLQGGDFSICKGTSKKATKSATRKTAAATKISNAHTVRGLWGNGKGRFQTKGRYAAATVRGTIYHVADRCDGTYTNVRQGIVSVLDLVLNKTFTIQAGQNYLAKNP
jgi:hypothetical protein